MSLETKLKEQIAPENLAVVLCYCIWGERREGSIFLENASHPCNRT